MQDAPRKRRDPCQTPGPWAGSIVHTEDGVITVSVSQERWDKDGARHYRAEAAGKLQGLSNILGTHKPRHEPLFEGNPFNSGFMETLEARGRVETNHG